MAAGLDALTDDNIGAGRIGGNGIVEPPDLIQDLASGRTSQKKLRA